MRSTRRFGLSLIVPVTLVAGVLAPSAAHATPPPTVTASILSPSNLDRVGQDGLFVDARGLVTDATTDGDPEGLSLFVDGTLQDDEDCDDQTATSCETDLFWDTSSASLGLHQLTVELTTSLSTSAPSAPVSVTVVAAANPRVTITSPSSGAVVTGAMTVTATGSVDAATDDAPTAMWLFLDGDPAGDPVECPPSVLTCTIQLPWDATGLSGGHTLLVAMLTKQTYELSNVVNVTVVNPPPTAALDVPNTQAVRGPVTLTGHGNITPAVSDSPRDLQLIVDGAPYGQPVPCQITASTTRSCVEPLPWNTTGLLGVHNVQVRFDTLLSNALSPVQQVTVLAPLSQPGQTVLTVKPAAYANGVLSARIEVHDAQHRALGGVPVSVTFTPAVGAPVTVQGTTNAQGVAVVGAHIKKVNTKIVASVGAAYGSARAVGASWATITVTCSVPASIHHAVKTKLTCKMPGLANSTNITLYYQAPKSAAHVLARAKAKSGKVTFTFSIAKKGQRLQVWAVVPTTKAYQTGVSRQAKLHVI